MHASEAKVKTRQDKLSVTRALPDALPQMSAPAGGLKIALGFLQLQTFGMFSSDVSSCTPERQRRQDQLDLPFGTLLINLPA
jgi:hypothetical protein